MISSDISTLFTKDAPGVRFRQATILTWNPSNGNNTVDLAGGTLTNVGMMNIGEAISLKPGHVVGMLGQGSAWFIIGRITLPGDPNFASASVAFDGDFGFVTNFAITTTRTTKATVTLQVPTWADEALVFMNASAVLVNPNAANALVDLYAAIDTNTGVVGRGRFSSSAVVDYSDSNTLVSHSQAVLSSPGATIACKADLQVVGGANWATSANQSIGISATAIYRSTT